MTDQKYPTPLLDDLEKGPWPSFIKEIKKSGKSPMVQDLLGLLERSYEQKIGHWKHGGLVGVQGYGGGVIGRYNDLPEEFPDVSEFHTVRVNQPSGWFYTSDALRTLCDIWGQHGSGITNMHGSTGDIVFLGTRTTELEPIFSKLSEAGFDLGGSGSDMRTPSCCNGMARCEWACYDTMALCNDLTQTYQDELHRPAFPYKFKIKAAGCPNDCVASIARSDMSIIGTWRDDIQIDQAEVREYAKKGLNVHRDIAGRCAPYRQPASVLSEGDDAMGAVACNMGAVDVLYELFDDRGAMDAAFGRRAYAADAYGGNCATDVTAQDPYSIGGQETGRVLCHRTGTESTIAWTDERVLVFGEAVREDLGDVELYEWWRSAGPVVPGSPAEKDLTGSVPKAPEGGYLSLITKAEDARIQEIAHSTPGTFLGSFGLRLAAGAYDVTQLGRFGFSETGTYVVAKGPRLVFTAEGSNGSIGSATYRWRVLPGGRIRLTLDRTYGAASTKGKQAFVPGPWPMSVHPWTRAPTGDVVYSTWHNQMVLDSITTLKYSNLSPPGGSDQDNVQPVWSPDGSRLAFASNRDGDYNLYVMNADGSSLERLTSEPGDELDPAWSPDGTKIAFHHNPPTGPGPTTLSVLDLADGAITDLVAIPGNVGKLPGTVGRPDWSPDGTRIVFRVQRRYQGSEVGFAETSIYVVNADGSRLTKLATEGNVGDSDPAWTPDGRRILFWGDRGSGRAFLSMRPDGSGVRPFGVPLPRDFLTLDWSPDGRWMVLGGAWDHPYPLYLVSADGSEVFVLEPTAGEPNWRPLGA